MINHRIFNKIEPQDINQFLLDCEQKSNEMGISLEYYVEEFILVDDEES